jgi:hypothetical protein
MATADQRQQFAMLSGYLQQIGLSSLFQLDAQGNPGGWLWNQLLSGIDTGEELQIAIQSTDVFRRRFGVIQEQQARAARGEPVYVMSPAEVIEYETNVKQMMRAAGLPPSFYDQPEDFHSLILKDISPAEIAERITQAYDYVLSAPPEVRAAFEDFYGVGNGDAQLAAWALDPDRTVRDITKATRTAYAAGMADRFDVQIDRAAAERIADLPQTEAGITEGMRQVAALANIFDEGLGDSGTDLTADTGVAAVFEGNADANLALSRRVLRREAANRTSTGGAAVTQQGVVGLGRS